MQRIWQSKGIWSVDNNIQQHSTRNGTNQRLRKFKKINKIVGGGEGGDSAPLLRMKGAEVVERQKEVYAANI